MSVRTTADEARTDAREALDRISFDDFERVESFLKRSLDPDVWGSEDYNKETVKETEKDIRTLQKIQRKVREMKKRYN